MKSGAGNQRGRSGRTWWFGCGGLGAGVWHRWRRIEVESNSARGRKVQDKSALLCGADDSCTHKGRSEAADSSKRRQLE
jgi:hypothetical protein